MSENSLSETYLSETYLNGMVHIIQPGDTPEYLEDLRKRGFITVSFKIDEAVENEYANVVVTSIDTTTDPNNYADGPAKQVTFIDSMTDTTNCSVTINNSNTTDTTVDPGSLDGPNPIGGGHHQYHFVQYGETQEYLESLVKEGYMMVYHEDNPPEEGKLTISKPNPEFHPMTDISATTQETLTDTTETEYIYGPYKPLQLTVEELIAALGPEKYEAFMNTTITATRQESRTAYTLVPVAEGEDSTIPGYKLVLVDLTEEEIAVFNELPHGDISFSLLTDEQKALILKAVQSYNNSLDEKETITTDTTDPNNWADGPSYPLNPETKDRINGEDIVVTIIDYHRGRMMGDMDPPGQESTPPPVVTIEDLTPVLIPVSSELLQRFEEAKKIRQRLAERSNPIAFVSIMDAETAAVKSVQVACAEDDGWRTIGTLNNPDGIDWKYQAGNLTGSGAASVVWHAQELGALGVWTDGTDNWTGIAGWFDANWTMLGCGDFDGDGKDSVLMSLNGGLFYSVDLDGTLTSLGDLNWGAWEFAAAGDFAGDGKDDIVLFHKGLGCVVLLADGNADDYTSIGQLDASDWNIAGAGDLDGDGRDDLLVRQTSTGIAGAYAGGDMNRWSVIDTTSDYYLA